MKSTDKIRDRIISKCKEYGITVIQQENGLVKFYCTDLDISAVIYPQQELEFGTGYKNDSAFDGRTRDVCYISEKEMQAYVSELSRISDTDLNKIELIHALESAELNCKTYNYQSFYELALKNPGYAEQLYSECEYADPQIYIDEDISSNEISIFECAGQEYTIQTRGLSLSEYIDSLKKNGLITTVERSHDDLICDIIEMQCDAVIDTSMLQKDRIRKKAYEKYQMDWMISHGYSISDIISELAAMESDDQGADVRSLYEEWKNDSGFSSEIWACYDEFLTSEYQDVLYMKKILSGSEYLEYLKDVSDDVDDIKRSIEVETPLGKLKAEIIPDSHYPGINISVLNDDDVASMPGAVIEYYPDKNCIRAVCYDDKSDEPVSIVKLYDKEDR